MFNFVAILLNSMKPEYSISDLENLSGIRAHTIRIWEQRFDLLNPERSEGNIRHYDDDDVRKLLNVVTLQRYGWKISRLGRFSNEELYAAVLSTLQLPVAEDKKCSAITDQMIWNVLQMNETGFESLFMNARKEMGFNKLVLQILFPLLRRIGLLWATAEVTPAQEHFISSLVKQKIISATDQLTFEYKIPHKFLLFTPETELHDIGLQMFNYTLRSTGVATVYLGQSLPFDNIAKAAKISSSDSLFFTMTMISDEEKIQQYLNKISSLKGFKWLCFSCNPGLLTRIKLPKNLHYIASPEELKKLILPKKKHEN